MNTLLIQPGAQAAGYSYGDGLMLALPAGATWISTDYTVNGTSTPLPIYGTEFKIGSGVLPFTWRDASGIAQTTNLTLTVYPQPPTVGTAPPTLQNLRTAAEQLGKLYNSYGANVICTGSINNVPLGTNAVIAFQQAWNAAVQAGTLVYPSYYGSPVLGVDGQYGPITANAFLWYATAARFYPQYIPPTCLNYVNNPPAQPPILHKPPPINPHPIHLQGVPAPQSPIALRGYNDGDLGYDGPDGNVYVSEWGRYGNVMAGGRYGGPNGGGFRDDMNPPCANSCNKACNPPCPNCTNGTGVGAPRFRRFAALASSTDLQTITNAVPTFNQILSNLKGQTDPANANVQSAVSALSSLIIPVSAATGAVASTITAPPASVTNAVTQATSAASAISTILAQFTAGTASPASVSQLLSNTQTLGGYSVTILSAYYAQVVINDGCPGVPADITNFQNSLNLAVTDNISAHPTPFVVSGILDAATIAAINVIYPGQAPNCVSTTPPVPPIVVVSPPVAPPAAAPQSTTTTVLEVLAAVAGVAAIGGLIYAMNKKPMKNPLSDVFDEEEMRSGYIIQDAPGYASSGYEVYHEGRRLWRVHGVDVAVKLINQHMEREGFYPNIYRVNDHGNIDLLNHKGTIIESRV